MIVWLSCLYMYLSVSRDRHTHTHTHTHTQSSIFDKKGADEQRSLLTGAEKCASGVDSAVPAQTGNGALWCVCLWCVRGVHLRVLIRRTHSGENCLSNSVS